MPNETQGPSNASLLGELDEIEKRDCVARVAAERILAAIEAIDRETPWTETEPNWWLNMKVVQKAIREELLDYPHA